MKKNIIAVIVLAIAAILFYGIRYARLPASTQIAYTVRYENVVEVPAYIVRYEDTYYADYSGTLYHYASEGARVGKDRLISTVFNGEVSEETLQELHNISKKIEDIETEQKTYEMFSSDESSVESKLDNIRTQIIDDAQNRQASKMKEYKAEINGISTSGEEYTQDTLEELRQQKTELEGSVSAQRSEIYSGISGIFSANTDGLEDVLTPDSITEYTVEDFNGVPYVGMGEKKNTVEVGNAVCKVVDNHNWYVMALVPKERLAESEEGDGVTLRFAELPGEECEAEIISISDESDDEENAVVVIKCDRYSEGVFSIRKSNIELVFKSHSGFLIPVHAIRVVDNQTGVLVKTGAKTTFKPCEIIYTDEENDKVIIKAVDSQNELSQYDTIIIGEDE